MDKMKRISWKKINEIANAHPSLTLVRTGDELDFTKGIRHEVWAIKSAHLEALKPIREVKHD